MSDPIIVNLLAHDVNVILDDKSPPLSFPTKGQCQVRMDVRDVTTNGLIKTGHWTHTRNLPPAEPNTFFIVGGLVAMFELQHNGRTDLLFPWGLVRDQGGKVLGCKALCNPR